MSFLELGIKAELNNSLKEKGFHNPTIIQNKIIPAQLEGKDVLAVAPTGTGKTMAFVLPLLQYIAEKPRGATPKALVLLPTRELVAQAEEAFLPFVRSVAEVIKTISLYGGVESDPQIQALKAGVDVVFATPGRLLDLQGLGFISVSEIEYLVVDEADQMLDLGFQPDLDYIRTLLPAERQTTLLSATFSDAFQTLGKVWLQEAVFFEIENTAAKNIRVMQLAYPLLEEDKTEALKRLLKDKQWGQVLVFTNTRDMAREVARDLKYGGFSAEAFHSERSQDARFEILQSFKDKKIDILVATDVAGRGLDISQLACVVNYDLPKTSEDYVHRKGRTGRAGRKGLVVSFVGGLEQAQLKKIQTFTKQNIRMERLYSFEVPRELSKTEKKAQEILPGQAKTKKKTASRKRHDKRERKKEEGPKKPKRSPTTKPLKVLKALKKKKPKK